MSVPAMNLRPSGGMPSSGMPYDGMPYDGMPSYGMPFAATPGSALRANPQHLATNSGSNRPSSAEPGHGAGTHLLRIR